MLLDFVADEECSVNLPIVLTPGTPAVAPGGGVKA